MSKISASLESISIGVLLIAFAVAVLIGWTAGDWWLVVPIFMLEAGVYYIAITGLVRPGEKAGTRHDTSPYYIFWGGTLAVLGTLFLVQRKYPGHGLLLFLIFIIWVGAIIVLFGVRGMKPRANP